ncbi:MAG: diacylglycerol kinase family protein [Clostridia bacterium]|nr:diacylglycerol kinase family protein [Clostridia bacterium]
MIKYKVLYNPAGNNGKGKENAENLKNIYSEDELEFIDLTTVNYSEFLASLDEEDSVVLCGGDGTLNRFINDVKDEEIKVPVFYYPCGSGNDFWKDVNDQNLSEPLNINEYIHDLPETEIQGKKYKFLNNVGFGIDGYCCEVGDKLRQTSNKPINYTSIAIKGLLFNYKPTCATITVDGVTKEYKHVWLAPTMNGRYYGGGMMPTPAQDRKDPSGTLSVMVLHCASKLKTLMIFPSIFKGEHIKHVKNVEVLTGKEISVKFDSPRAAQVDGETILGVTEYTARATK